MNPLETTRIGSTNLTVTRLGLGGGPLGDTVSVSDEQAIATVERALQLGIRYIDTAPHYGLGRSEVRIGMAVSKTSPEDLVISTKVGRLLRPGSSFSNDPGTIEEVFDFSYDGVVRSLKESASRLGQERVDIAFIHDPDDYFNQAMREAYRALDGLRSQGIVTAIGAGMNQWEMELKFAREGRFDCFLLAGRYTLLDQTAAELFLPYCVRRKISVIIGAPFQYGLLVSKLEDSVRNVELIRKARQIKAVCEKHDVPLKAAALQFVLAHPAVAAVIPGSRSPEEVSENFQMIQTSIPHTFWEELLKRGLISSESVAPNHE